MAARLTIAASGNVTEVAFAPYPDTTLYGQSFEACLTNEIRTWKFLAPNCGGPAFVTFKWDFKPSDR